MNGCQNAVRPGCRGLLCRGARAHLRRLTVLRYPIDDSGRPDISAEPGRGWICALTAAPRVSGNTSLDIPGVIGADAQMVLTAAAGNLEPPLVCGDRIKAEGRLWQVYSVSGSGPISARLVPGEEL